MKKISQTTQFARDVKRMRKRGKDLTKLESIVTKLASGTSLEPMHKDHPLFGDGNLPATAILNPTGF